MTAALIILGFIAVLSILSVEVGRHRAEAERNSYRAQLEAAQIAHVALLTQQLDIKDATISRQQETIEKAHTRMVLPIEQAAVDVRNQDEHVQQPTAAMMYPEEFPQVPSLSTSPTDLPRDLDTPPDAL